MILIKEDFINNYLNKTESKTQTELTKKSKIASYFDYIYTYPPKIKIKWDSIDDFKTDYFSRSTNSNKKTKTLAEEWVFAETPEEAIFNTYTKSQYIDGFLDKINSSNFFIKKTEPIQKALANIPIFVVMNGQNEIVLSKPANVLGAKNFSTFTKEKLYDTCGAFDPAVEKKLELGLFFMDRSDADKYLKEVARADFEGTQTVGLSINCLGLDSAYKITREHHPGVDFRFVPNFKEVQDLLTGSIGKSNMIVEHKQQQLRFRRRNINLLPYLNKLSSYITPSSFLQRNEYFKGVPVYIVQVNNNPTNFWVDKYFNLVGMIDTISSRCLHNFGYTLGFGHNWIMQGSLNEPSISKKGENYIFFEKSQAMDFCKKYGRKVGRYSGGRFSTLGEIIRKPKIFVYNLEDFLEDWENTIFQQENGSKDRETNFSENQSTHFISSNAIFDEIDNFSKASKMQNIGQLFNVKFKVLKRAVGVFFSI